MSEPTYRTKAFKEFMDWVDMLRQAREQGGPPKMADPCYTRARVEERIFKAMSMVPKKAANAGEVSMHWGCRCGRRNFTTLDTHCRNCGEPRPV